MMQRPNLSQILKISISFVRLEDVLSLLPHGYVLWLLLEPIAFVLTTIIDVLSEELFKETSADAKGIEDHVKKEICSNVRNSAALTAFMQQGLRTQYEYYFKTTTPFLSFVVSKSFCDENR